MSILQVQEVTQGAWFALGMVLTLMFAHIAWRAYHDLGYHSPETKAAISLTFFFFGSALSRSWHWATLWFEQHGFPNAAAFVYSMSWWPVVAGLIGISGALCAVRVFYPKWVKSRRLFTCGASWLVPLIAVLLFLILTTFIKVA